MTGLLRPWAGSLAVATFQLRRMLTIRRIALGLVGAAFPAAVTLAVRRVDDGFNRDFLVVLIYALIPEMTCILGLLVTMCPAVADELERGTWAHIAVRPGGRRALLVGTFLAAVGWTSGVALVSLALTLAAAGVDHAGDLGLMFAVLILLSCIGRGALFALPAVIAPKRALVASVGAAIVVEYLAGFLPAVVNQLTVSLRLRSLLIHWMGWRRSLPVEIRMLVDTAPAWVQVGAVVTSAVVLLGVAVAILERRQFPPTGET